MAPLLEVDNLHVRFPTDTGGVTVLKGVDLAVQSGERVGLVGESGSGKSVLAWSILGLLQPPGQVEAGSIRYRGVDLCQAPEEELQKLRGREIALIASNPRAHLNPVATVGEQLIHVFLAHQPLGRKEAAAKALQMLEAVGIPDPPRRMAAYPHQLSGGMAQRIVIALALACDPKLLIADAPTSGLDVTIQVQILDLIHELLQSKGLAALITTRDLGVVAHYCDKVAVLREGRVVEFAAVKDFFARPAHPYSKSLLGAGAFERQAGG
ncbi:MAG: ABC transporter ATP-binding protein [Candidatus Tectomicrobia bacterium]|nr:ABC transporter ATP-binding protein [Candidatus Tectomicrobia bacterium]